ncbi:hypothetical protein PG999_004515 [Apiospora kogelbergensis]|uniref:Uncharacterized protein n=1 Tax=Apiospora kogelbergensis TaxID=1337665 RepID=A0AAW0QZH8_9PEZI
MDAFVQRSSRRKPSTAASQNSERFGESSQAIDSHVTDFNDSISVPNYFTSSPPRFSSPSVSVDTAPEPLTDLPPFPDYTVWTPAIFSHLPGLLLCHDTTKELAWWWRPKPPIHTNHYVFVASTSKSIERHLAAKHHIHAPRSSRHAADARGRSLASFLPVDRHNPFEQALLGRVNNMYSSRRTTLLLLNWLLRENLPFHTVDTPAFEQVIKSLNPIASIPHSKSFLRLLDCHWKQWTFLLGLPPVKGRHRGIDIASHVADTIDDFGFASSVGYATLDNASSNTTCMEAMGTYFDFDPAERRISCAPHTINLVTKAMMYGTKRDNFAELLRTVGSIHPDTDITEGGRDMVAADVQALDEALDEVIFYEEPPELEFGEDTTYEGLDLLDDPIQRIWPNHHA